MKSFRRGGKIKEEGEHMNRQSNLPVITISRQYGAGGRTIARGLSARFDIPWYDKDFAAETAAKSGYSEEDIRQEGEQLSAGGRFLNSVLNTSAAYSSSHDGIFLAQKQVIMDLSAAPCIIVGRCADYILEGMDNLIRIFIYAPFDVRVLNCMNQYSCSKEEARRMVVEMDSKRDHEHRRHCGYYPDDKNHQDIMINSSLLGMDRSADFLVEIIKEKFGL